MCLLFCSVLFWILCCVVCEKKKRIVDNKKEITQKKIKQLYYDKTMVNFCKGCDVHMFFLNKL